MARHFAEAIFRGKAGEAVSLLAHPDDATLSSLAAHAAAPWTTEHAAVRLTGARSGGAWVFGYFGTHPQADGRFEEVRGEIVVVVAASRQRAGVEFFTLRNKAIRFRTHHDSVLLPSDR